MAARAARLRQDGRENFGRDGPQRGRASGGIDHLLFVLGLVLIVSDRWMLIKTVTAFTVAHSITLAIATLGFVSAPVLPLNAAIALSILFLGPEIIRKWRGETSFTIRHPWVVAFAFGLLHGFGFASGLATMGLASSGNIQELRGPNITAAPHPVLLPRRDVVSLAGAPSAVRRGAQNMIRV